jgi:hypothetical protein
MTSYTTFLIWIVPPRATELIPEAAPKGCRAHRPPLQSILLANVQSLDNKVDELRERISFQRDIRDWNILSHGIMA